MVHHAVVGRLLEAARISGIATRHKYSHVTTYRDIANAFPSVTHEAMNDTLRRTTDSFTRQQLKARHEQLYARISVGDGRDLIIRPRIGGAQGDKVMPPQFRRTYEPLLAKWLAKKAEDLSSTVLGKDPMTGEEVDVSMTSYADDVKEINMVGSAQDALEKIARSTVLLDAEITEAGLKQNAGKAEHVAAFLGHGQDSFTKKLRQDLDIEGMGGARQAGKIPGGVATIQWFPTDRGQETY